VGDSVGHVKPYVRWRWDFDSDAWCVEFEGRERFWFDALFIHRLARMGRSIDEAVLSAVYGNVGVETLAEIYEQR
jgi:hypothetical protein